MKDIWPNGKKLEVVGLTGEYSSGKTLGLLTIDPANTRYYDFEKSGGTYDGLGVDRIDVPDSLLERHSKGYTPRQAFEWWYADIKKIEPGKFSVIATDPISDIEEGVVEWVKARYSEFGFSSAAKFESTGGIFWAKVKSEWKRILADIAARCQTFAFSTHLKKVWVNGRPTKDAVPKGKSTLMELASLYLQMEREADKDGKVAQVPSAVVLKSRLAETRLVDGAVEIIPTLPPRLPKATWDAVRAYMIAPPDYGKLKVGERAKERVLTDDDKLELQREIAADTRAAEEAALATAQEKAKLEEAKEAARARLRPSSDKAAETRKKQEAASKPQEEAPKDEPATEGQEPDGPKQEVSDAAAEQLLTNAEEVGCLDRVKKAVVKTVLDRHPTLDPELVTPTLLTQDEYAKFAAGIEKLRSK